MIASSRTQVKRYRRRGQTAVEFALVMIVLLAMVYGIIEIGKLVLIKSELTNAAREGAQVASLHPNWNSDCIKRNAVNPHLSLLKPADVLVDRPALMIAPFKPITVTVQTTWTSMINFVPDPATLSLRPLGPYTLRSSSTKLIETGSMDPVCP